MADEIDFAHIEKHLEDLLEFVKAHRKDAVKILDGKALVAYFHVLDLTETINDVAEFGWGDE